MNTFQSTSPPHLYSQLQQRLYQAFIFSILILFSIILSLLFYLFYLKKRSSPTPSPLALPASSNQAPFASSSEMVPNEKLKEKLEVFLFNEDLQTRDLTMCCVCLGEFEVGEELHQIVTCKHVFHVDCICYWLHSKPTCPLCRCFIVSTAKHSCISQPIYGSPNPVRRVVNRNPMLAVSPQQQEQIVTVPAEMVNNL